MYIFLFIFLISSIFSYIIFPLSKDQTALTSSDNQTEFFSKMRYNKLYITINIGSKKINLKAFLIQSKTELIIAGKDINNHKYNETESETYNIIFNQKISFQYGMYKEGLLSRDNFNMLNENNQLINSEIDFVLGTESSSTYDKIREGEVGLNLPLLQSFPDYNLIISLKRNNVISSCIWYLDFDNLERGEGKMIIDGFPHSLNNKKYNRDNFVKTNAINNKYSFAWGLIFSNIYYGEQNLKINSDEKAHFGFDYGVISAPQEIGELLESLFFKEYISKNICFRQKFEVYGNFFFYCRKNEELNIEKFASIYFKSTDLNIIFELDYHDLFYSDDKYIYLMIEFSKNNKIWILGEIFLKKYYIVFNQKEKTLGYYTKMEKPRNIKNRNNDNSIYNKLIIIVITTLFFICLVSFGVYVYNNKKPRKKKANELDDEYNYDARFDSLEKDKASNLTDKNIIN